MHDLVIRGGLVVDGTGAAPYRADVAVDDGLITAIVWDAGPGRTEIDAHDRIVTPGFVDIHTHYDGQAIWSDRLTPSSAHGVTTAILGNCGVGFAPCRPQDRDLLIRFMEGVEDIPGAVMAEGLDWSWESFPDYLDALDARRRDIDVAVLLPHSPLRVFVMGDRGARRESATASDLARMRILSREAIEAGAIGFGTSRLMMHRTKSGDNIPSFEAADEELRAIASGMNDAGAGIIQMVLNVPLESWDDEIRHLVDLVEHCGRPATFTLGTSNRGPRTWEAALGCVAAANARGAAISAQVLPRPVGLMMGHELSTNPFSLCPSYQALESLPFDMKIERLRDERLRSALLAECPVSSGAFVASSRNWDWIFPFGDPPDYEPSADQSVAALARKAGVAPQSWAYDYLLEQGGRAFLYATLGNYHDGRLDAVHDLMNHPDVVVGLGDGGAHYAAICDASYPTFMLTYWSRDRAGPRLSLPRTIKALSQDPARIVGLDDRGILKAGYKADINVIDWARLTLHAPEVRFDLPAGGRRLDQRATGFDATIVTGRIVARFDTATGDLPGRLVRGARSTACAP